MSTRMQDVFAAAFDELRYHPIERRIRADDAVDSTRALLVWEPRRVVPSYAVPEQDVHAEVTPCALDMATVAGVLHPGIPFTVHTAAGEPVSVGERFAAGFRLADPAGYVVLDFNAFDAWYEEDERVRGHPRDPFSRIDVRATSRPVRIERDGQVLAETTRARMLFETGIHTRFYILKEDVRGELVPSERRSYCPYKGEASYWSLGEHRDIAWSYEDPLPDGPLVKGLVAFWDERVDVFVDGQRRARPGGDIAGAMKDEFGA
jgi:uncharacterized protein (DUF427 family)